jgi:hypothetical protein
MRLLKTALTLLALLLLTTCGGDHLNSITAPKNITCDSAFGGDWHWVLQTCGGFTDDVAHGQLSTTNGCRLTLDTTPAALKAQGQSYTLIVAFDTQKATLERKGTVCDAIDQGKIVGQNGRQFSIQFTPTPTEKCCNTDYFATIAY